MLLEGRTAIVTGATSGIGRGIAEVFAREGANVAVIGRSRGGGAKTVDAIEKEGGTARFFECDVSEPDEIDAMVDAVLDRYGELNALVNCAGIGIYKDIVSTSVDEIDQTLSVNLRGLMLVTRACLPHLKASGSGAVVNVSSVHSTQSSPGDAPYATTKGGIDAFSRSTALDFAPEVRVNVIQPGWVDSALTKGIYDDLAPEGATGDDVRSAIASQQPMKRIGDPMDIGEAAAFFASDRASFITGASLLVDGGLSTVLESWSTERVRRLMQG